MKSYLREPLLHFIVLGAALFIGDALWEKRLSDTAYTIHVSPEDMHRQTALFESENRRAPSDDDLQNLLFAHVEEQVLMREARRIGLDADDAIIRRRLAQKMRFMINDTNESGLPKDAVLRDWFEENNQKFVQPETRSFEHIFFSLKTREAALEADAQVALDAGIAEGWESLGDPFIKGRRFNDTSQAGVIKDFGRDFAGGVFALQEGEWSAPIGSDFGLHLVRVSKITPRGVPNFESVREHAEALWLEIAARDDNLNQLKQLIEKYNIVIDEDK